MHTVGAQFLISAQRLGSERRGFAPSAHHGFAWLQKEYTTLSDLASVAEPYTAHPAASAIALSTSLSSPSSNQSRPTESIALSNKLGGPAVWKSFQEKSGPPALQRICRQTVDRKAKESRDRTSRRCDRLIQTQKTGRVHSVTKFRSLSGVDKTRITRAGPDSVRRGIGEKVGQSAVDAGFLSPDARIETRRQS